MIPAAPFFPDSSRLINKGLQLTAFLTINHVTKSYSFHLILSDVSFVVNAGERIGLVGANGVGKSTLLKIVTGEIAPDSGETLLAPDHKLGYLAQIIEGFDDRTLDDLIAASVADLRDLEARMRDLERQMTTAQGDGLAAVMDDYGEAADRFERYGGYEIDYRIDLVLTGLGVAAIPRDRQFGTLSGGEKARVGLALLLLQSPDVLLLDEPTNHLDFATMRWLEDYLQGYRGAILVVSHDREFLNRIATAIIELDEHSRTAKRYSGDYDSYHRAKAQERQQWQQDYAQQQEEIKELRIAIKQTAHRNSNYRAHTDNDKFVVNIKRSNSRRDRVQAHPRRRGKAQADRSRPDPQATGGTQVRSDLRSAGAQGAAADRRLAAEQALRG